MNMFAKILVVFVLVLWKWRYISLASISSAASIPLLVFLFEKSFALFFATLIIGAIVIWRHKGNIELLRSGAENKFNL